MDRIPQRPKGADPFSVTPSVPLSTFPANQARDGAWRPPAADAVHDDMTLRATAWGALLLLVECGPNLEPCDRPPTDAAIGYLLAHLDAVTEPATARAVATALGMYYRWVSRQADLKHAIGTLGERFPGYLGGDADPLDPVWLTQMWEDIRMCRVFSEPSHPLYVNPTQREALRVILDRDLVVL